MFLSSGLSSTGKPDRSCGGAYVVPLIISIPSMIRLRQCLIEFLRVRNNAHQNASTGWGGCADSFVWNQHEDEANKTMQTTPSKCSEVFQRFPSHCSERTAAWDRPKIHRNERDRPFSTLVSHSSNYLRRLPLIDMQAVLRLSELVLLFLLGRRQSIKPSRSRTRSTLILTGLFVQDWDLTLFAPSSVRNNPDHPWALRRHTHFHTREMYYGAILIDLMLRCTWSFKLSPHLDHFNDLEGTIFIMELLEVLRRMWSDPFQHVLLNNPSSQAGCGFSSEWKR